MNFFSISFAWQLELIMDTNNPLIIMKYSFEIFISVYNEVRGAAERLKSPSSYWTRAAKVMAAVSALNILAPKETETNPASLRVVISSLVTPPSGPIIPTTCFAGGNVFRTCLRSMVDSSSQKTTFKPWFWPNFAKHRW